MAWLQYVLFRYMAGGHYGRPYNARQLLFIPNS